MRWGPPAHERTCPHSAQPDWRALATHLPQDNPREGRGEAIWHRVGLGARRQCAAWDPSKYPLIHDPPPCGQNARDPLVRFRWTLTPAHPGALSHSLTGFFGGQHRVFFINDTYRKHDRRPMSAPLGPRARCLRERAHVGGGRPSPADAHARRAVPCACTVCRRAEVGASAASSALHSGYHR